MKLSDGFNGADLRNVCTEAGAWKYIFCGLSLVLVHLVHFVDVLGCIWQLHS